ncbi:MAG TPA: PAS domain S-box protein [Candidatus Acidoferrum sp.]|jgi:PAS domain S-box-containing protein|nr:PAS domain S-box protein [Candidatus Acidoferrum sp.]
MSAQYRVLIVEDSINDAFFIVSELRRGGLDVEFERVETAAEVQAALARKRWDFIICDFGLRGFDGLAVLALYRRIGLDIPFIMVSGRLGEEHAVEMLKAGAHEYVLKENLTRLVPAVNRELRAAQERRIRSQMEGTVAYLASIVESCDDAVIGTTLDGAVLTWNAGAERLYGYAASEMIGRSVSVLIPAFRAEELLETFGKLSRGERLEDLEMSLIRKGGSVVDVSLMISPIKDASGRFIGASTVARDITRRKREENERLGLIQDLTAALAAKPGQPQPTKADPNS